MLKIPVAGPFIAGALMCLNPVDGTWVAVKWKGWMSSLNGQWKQNAISVEKSHCAGANFMWKTLLNRGSIWHRRESLPSSHFSNISFSLWSPAETGFWSSKGAFRRHLFLRWSACISPNVCTLFLRSDKKNFYILQPERKAFFGGDMQLTRCLDAFTSEPRVRMPVCYNLLREDKRYCGLAL